MNSDTPEWREFQGKLLPHPSLVRLAQSQRCREDNWGFTRVFKILEKYEKQSAQYENLAGPWYWELEYDTPDNGEPFEERVQQLAPLIVKKGNCERLKALQNELIDVLNDLRFEYAIQCARIEATRTQLDKLKVDLRIQNQWQKD